MWPVGSILFSLILILPNTYAQETCLGNKEESLKVLQSLRDSLECAGSENLQDCRNSVGLGQGLVAAAAVAGAGRLASMRPVIQNMCRRPGASLFFERADAAPITCQLDGHLVARSSMEYLDELDSALKKEIAKSGNNLSRIREWSSLRTRNADMTNNLREIKRILDTKPEKLLITNNRGVAASYSLETAKKRSREIGRLLQELDDIAQQNRSPVIVQKMIQERMGKMTTGLAANRLYNDIMSRSTSTATTRYIDSIKNLTPEQQLVRLMSDTNRPPGLNEYERSLRHIRALELQSNEVRRAKLEIRNMGGRGPGEVLKRLENIRLSGLSNIGERANAALRLHNFRAGMRAAVNEGVDLRQAARSIKGLAGRGIVRIGGTVLMAAASLPVMAAEAALTPSRLACATMPAGEFVSYDDNCEALPVIGEDTARYLYDVAEEDQLKELSNANFCKVIKEIHGQQSQERWKLECTGRGFNLTDKKSKHPLAMDFNVDAEGKLERMRFLNNRGSRYASSSNFAVSFGNNEEPEHIFTLFPGVDAGQNGSNLAFTFQKNENTHEVDGKLHDRTNKVTRIPASRVLDPDNTRNYGFVSRRYNTVKAARYATAVGQMCCTETKGNLDQICSDWGVKRRASAPSNNAPARSSGNQ